MNLVGLPSSDAIVTESTGRWFEPIAADRLGPANLYEAQLARLLNERRIVELLASIICSAGRGDRL